MEVLTGAAAKELWDSASPQMHESDEDSPLEVPTTGEDILALFGDRVVTVYVPAEVPLFGQMRFYEIEQLSPKREAALDAKIDRRNGRAITVQDRDQATLNSAAYTIAETVHIKVGEGDSAQYNRAFTVAQLLGEPEVKQNGKVVKERKLGLFDHQQAKEFVDTLAAMCYRVNPALMPSVKKMAERALMADYGLTDEE